jgi:hypothetical protein
MPHSTFATNGFHLSIQGSSTEALAVLASLPLMLHQGIPVHCDCCPECKQKWKEAIKIANNGISATQLAAGMTAEAAVST